MKRHLRSALLLVGTLLLIFLMVVWVRPRMDDIDSFLLQIGYWGPAFAILLYTVLSVTPIPTDPITIVLGALYGPVWGLVISWLGNSTAALFEYFIAHHISRAANFEKLRHHLPWGLDKAPIDSVWFLTLGRIVPGFGSKAVSILAGLYHVPLVRYLWTTALMNFIGGIGYILTGYLIARF